jgi:hypothetical protein
MTYSHNDLRITVLQYDPLMTDVASPNFTKLTSRKSKTLNLHKPQVFRASNQRAFIDCGVSGRRRSHTCSLFPALAAMGVVFLGQQSAVPTSSCAQLALSAVQAANWCHCSSPHGLALPLAHGQCTCDCQQTCEISIAS